MKSIVVLAALTLAATPALAVKGPQNVSRTIHNLSTTPSALGGEGWDSLPGSPGGGMETYATNEDEVCIFCHTPHGGSLNGPLWNRNLPDGSIGQFSHYSSATLTAAAAVSNRAVNDQSLLCLSCHDGSIGVNHVINPSNNNPTGQPDNLAAGGDIPIFSPARIGDTTASGAQTFSTGDLSDDHPISFSYNAAYAEESAPGGPDGLIDPATAVGRGVRFFGAGNNVECSSCHDPHVSYMTWLDAGADPGYNPFLVTTNSASYLCLSCHNK